MLVRTRPEWKEVVSRLHASRDREGTKVFSFDWETRDRGYPDVKLVGFSVGYYDDNDNIHGAYVPVGHAGDDMQLRPEDVNEDLKVLLEDPDTTVAMHNAPYDVLISRLLPEPVFVHENIDDTMLLAWLLNTNGVGSYPQIESGNGEKGLKPITLFYMGYKMQELTELAPMHKRVVDGVEFDDMRVDLVPIAELGPYAYDDAIYTLQHRELFLWGYDAFDRPKRVLKPGFRALLPDVLTGIRNIPEVNRCYEAIEKEFIFSLVDMTDIGVLLSKDRLNTFREPVEKELGEVRRDMFACRPAVDFEQIVDPDLVRKACDEYDRLDELCALPADHPNRPKNPKNGKPRGKGWLRKELFKAFGLADHPVVDKIRDDRIRPYVKANPDLAPKIFNVNSTQQLNVVLFDECEIPPIGAKGDSGFFSTDKECIKTWASQDYEMAKHLQRLRVIDKLFGTYLVGMPAQVPSDGRIRTRFGRVRTGRLSSSDPNLQNIPTADEFPVREAFIASGLLGCLVTVLEWHMDGDEQLKPKKVLATTPDDGYTDPWGQYWNGGWLVDDGRVVEWWGSHPPMVMMVADYSQLEIRLLAHISKDKVLVDAVRAGEDIHALTAQAVFDEVPDNISLAEVKKFYGKYRKDAKPVNFGVIYGMGPPALSAALGISMDEARNLIDNRYMKKYRGVKKWIDSQHRFVHKHGYVKTAIGRRRHLPAGMKDMSEHFAEVKGAERQAQNTPIQGFAADIIGLAMRDTRRFFRKTDARDAIIMADRDGNTPDLRGALWRRYVRYVLQIHDELVGESHPAVANYFMDTSVDLMENAGGIKLRVPLAVDAALGADWFNTKE